MPSSSAVSEPSAPAFITAASAQSLRLIPLNTRRLRLRPLRGDDLLDLHAILSHPMVSQYDEWEPCTLEESREDLETAMATPLGTPGEWNMVGVEFASTGMLVGILYLLPEEQPHCQFELGYFFNPAFHGQGLATEAVSAMLKIAFAMGAHRVFSRVDPRNAASVRLLERLDFCREGLLRQSCFCKGEWCDELVYATLG